MRTENYGYYDIDVKTYERTLLGEYFFFMEGKALYIAKVGGPAYLVKVIPSSEFSIKINKKSVSAIDGPEGVFRFVERAIRKDFMTCYVDAIIDIYFPVK